MVPDVGEALNKKQISKIFLLCVFSIFAPALCHLPQCGFKIKNRRSITPRMEAEILSGNLFLLLYMQRYFSSLPLLPLPKFQSLPTIANLHLPIQSQSSHSAYSAFKPLLPTADQSAIYSRIRTMAAVPLPNVTLMDAPTNITSSEADAHAEPAAAFLSLRIPRI